MIPELLWIVGIYAVSAAWVHAVIGRNNAAPRRHYVLAAGNQALRMEWYIRALRYFSRKTGTDIAITVVLKDSTDETGQIVELFARSHDGIRLVRADRSGSEDGSCGPAAKPIEQIRQVESTGEGEPFNQDEFTEQGGSVNKSESAEMWRRQMMRTLETGGEGAFSGPVIWVELDRREDLRQLPI